MNTQDLLERFRSSLRALSDDIAKIAQADPLDGNEVGERLVMAGTLLMDAGRALLNQKERPN